MKTVIIGAGIIGAAAAFRLARAGADVRVIDAGLGRATDASFGWINGSFYLDPHHHRLRVEGMAAWHRLTSELDLPVNWCGCLCWETQGAELEAQRDALFALGYTTDLLDRAALAGLEPALAQLPDQALRFAQEGAAESGAAADALLRGALDLGAEVLRGVGAERLLTTSAGQLRGLLTSAGTIAADRVLIAAGTGSQALLEAEGCALPMVPRPALVVRTRPVPPLLSHVLVGPFGELRQLPDGSLLLPAAVGHQADDADRLEGDPVQAAEAALERIRDLLPGVDLALEETTVAWRPVPADGLPVIGAVPGGPEGLWVAAMHSGITLAAITAELVAQEMLAGPTRETERWLAPYRPDRFAAAGG